MSDKKDKKQEALARGFIYLILARRYEADGLYEMAKAARRLADIELNR